MRKQEYLNSLNKQLEEHKYKRKYDTLMSEHERRVNDKDIKAYEVMDTQVSYAKIPGMRSNEQNLQDKYINKLFN